jgi:hypothetical protein
MTRAVNPSRVGPGPTPPMLRRVAAAAHVARALCACGHLADLEEFRYG